MNFGILNEFTRNLNNKLISEKGKTLKQSWADFRPEGAWHGPGPEEKMTRQPMPSGLQGCAQCVARLAAAHRWARC
jgi:hypothetical protein